jgi:hypothetical protein
MNLGINDIVPAALHRKVSWDMRHHFMAEKIVERFGLQLPRDRELVRQLAVIYVLGGLRVPPAVELARTTVMAAKTQTAALRAAASISGGPESERPKEGASR